MLALEYFCSGTVYILRAELSKYPHLCTINASCIAISRFPSPAAQVMNAGRTRVFFHFADCPASLCARDVAYDRSDTSESLPWPPNLCIVIDRVRGDEAGGEPNVKEVPDRGLLAVAVLWTAVCPPLRPNSSVAAPSSSSGNKPLRAKKSAGAIGGPPYVRIKVNCTNTTHSHVSGAASRPMAVSVQLNASQVHSAEPRW